MQYCFCSSNYLQSKQVIKCCILLTNLLSFLKKTCMARGLNLHFLSACVAMKLVEKGPTESNKDLEAVWERMGRGRFHLCKAVIWM